MSGWDISLGASEHCLHLGMCLQLQTREFGTRKAKPGLTQRSPDRMCWHLALYTLLQEKRKEAKYGGKGRDKRDGDLGWDQGPSNLPS